MFQGEEGLQLAQCEERGYSASFRKAELLRERWEEGFSVGIRPDTNVGATGERVV